jgi:anti-sigma factor RsiW
MGCERYQKQLMDAALGGLEPGRETEVRAHVAECGACREEFERQQRLVLAMDRAIDAVAAVEPSPEFTARVRTKIAEQPAPTPSWFGGWVPVAAGALAVLALVVWLIPRRATPQAPTPSPIAKVAPRGEEPPAVARVTPPVSKPPRVRHAVPTPVVAAARRELPEVLVPQDQQLGVRWLYNALGRQPERVGRILSEVAAQTEAATTPIEIQELKIAPLEIRPLQPEEKNGRT